MRRDARALRELGRRREATVFLEVRLDAVGHGGTGLTPVLPGRQAAGLIWLSIWLIIDRLVNQKELLMKPTPPGWPRISSSLYYEDPKAAIEWLCKAFGF